MGKRIGSTGGVRDAPLKHKVRFISLDSSGAPSECTRHNLPSRTWSITLIGAVGGKGGRVACSGRGAGIRSARPQSSAGVTVSAEGGKDYGEDPCDPELSTLLIRDLPLASPALAAGVCTTPETCCIAERWFLGGGWHEILYG
jgi:hypothetical protein